MTHTRWFASDDCWKNGRHLWACNTFEIKRVDLMSNQETQTKELQHRQHAQRNIRLAE